MKLATWYVCILPACIFVIIALLDQTNIFHSSSECIKIIFSPAVYYMEKEGKIFRFLLLNHPSQASKPWWIRHDNNFILFFIISSQFYKGLKHPETPGSSLDVGSQIKHLPKIGSHSEIGARDCRILWSYIIFLFLPLSPFNL